MQHMEGSGTPVLYIGRKVLKAAGCTKDRKQLRCRAAAVSPLTARGHSLHSIRYTPQSDDSIGPRIPVQ